MRSLLRRRRGALASQNVCHGAEQPGRAPGSGKSVHFAIHRCRFSQNAHRGVDRICM